MRKKVQKQQSLPDNNNVPRRKSLKESLMEVVKKPKQFESLKQSLVTLRSNTATVIPEEKEENLTPKEKEPPIKELHSESKSLKKCNFGNLHWFGFLDFSGRGSLPLQIAPLWHSCLTLLGTCAKGGQFYCPSRIYPAIPYCSIFPFLDHYESIFF